MTSSVNLLDLAAAALSSAIVAADHVKAMSNPDEAQDKNVRLKKDGTFVTDADFAAQGIIVQSLRSVSEDVRLVGEESEEEMSEQMIVGLEEKSLSMFRLAQKEILTRYHNHSDDTDQPLPLAQIVKNSIDQTDTTIPKNTQNERNSSNPDLVKFEECQVDPKRVSIFIDPLDGTKAYANGEYETVSILIGIILDQIPCFGVICKPFGYSAQTSILDTGCVAFYGGTMLGAAYTAGGSMFKKNIDTMNGELPRAVISSSKAKGVVQEFVNHLGSKGMIDPEPLMISGAGEKSLRILLRDKNEGLWFYPKSGTSLWDVAASDALLRATGGRLTDKNGKDMDYSKSRMEARNENGVVACYNRNLHAECIRLFLDGSWTET